MSRKRFRSAWGSVAFNRRLSLSGSKSSRCLTEQLESRVLLSAAIDQVNAIPPAASLDQNAQLLLPSVQVTSPSANGDAVRAPGPFTIQWSTAGFIGAIPSISLYYDTDNQPGGEVPIATNIADAGQFSWQVPSSLIGTQVYVETVATAGRTIVSDYSAAPLSIRRPMAPPLLNLSGLQRSYTPGGDGLLIDPQASLADADSNRFPNGNLVVKVEQPSDTDTLDIRSLGFASDGITTADNQVFFQGKLIGRFGGGQGGSPLQISLTENADLSAVQALIRNISFSSKSPGATGISKPIDVVLNDGFGGVSAYKIPIIIKPIFFTPTNYAVLFAGGGDSSNNHVRYYNNVKNLYQTLTTKYGLSPSNIYILYADGTSSGADQNPDNGGSAINSNMSYAAGAHIMSATHDNLNTTLNSLASTIQSWDYLLFWSFDHGGGAVQDTSQTTEEQLIGWGSNIRDDELAPWLNAIHTAHSTYVHTQCFAGGMQDDIQAVMPSTAFSMAATNHYEYSWGDSFAAAFNQALQHGYKMTSDAYRYSYLNDPNATGGQGPGGTWTDGVEHPWSTGSNFRIFYTPNNVAPVLNNSSITRGSAFTMPAFASYGDLVAATGATDANGDAVDFRIESVSNGTLLKNGAPVTPGVTTVTYGDWLEWDPSTWFFSKVPAFSVRGWDGLAYSSTTTQAYVDSGFGGVFGMFGWSGSNSNAEGNALPDNSLHFGNATLGELVPAVKGITLSNPGGGPLTISGFAANLGKDFNVIVRDPSGRPVPILNGQFVIPANSAFSVDVQFSPTAPGTRAGTLSFFTDDPNDKGIQHTLSFDGVGQGMHAPTLTKVGTLTGAFINTPFTISRDMLLQQADAADLDPGTILRLRIDSILAGTLTRNGLPVIPGDTLLQPGESLVWTPPAQFSGTAAAFTMSAVDDTNLSSAPSVTVNVAVRQPVRLTATGNSNLRLLTVNADNMFQVFTTDPPTGQPIYSAPLSQVGSFEFDGGLGDDALIIASPLPFTPVFHGQAGHDSLIIRAGNYSYPADIRAETDSMSLQVSGSSTVTLGGSQEFSNMILIGLCKVGLIPGTSASLGVESLSIGRGSIFDMGDGSVRVAANADTRNSVLKSVSSLIASARNSQPLWNGPGITSSSAAADPLMGLGAILNNDGMGHAIYATFANQPADVNSILIKFTINGDANLDGKLDASDYFLIDKGFLSQSSANPLTGYRNGDFDYSGKIDASDYFLIDKSFLSQTSSATPAFSQTPIAASAAPRVTRKLPKAHKGKKLFRSRF